jgi:hypothetical protein
VAADAWVEATKLRPSGATAAATDADAPFGRVFFRFAGPVGFAPEAVTLTAPALRFDEGEVASPAVELRRPGSASSPNEYRSADEQASLKARADACRRDTPQRACQNIVDFGASRSFALDLGPLRWQGRWVRYEFNNGEARLDGDLVLAVREPRRWRLATTQVTLRDAAGAVQTLDIPAFDVRFVDRITLDAPLHAEPVGRRADTEMQIEVLLPGTAPDFELRLPPLRVDGQRIATTPIRFEKRSLDSGVEPFNC